MEALQRAPAMTEVEIVLTGDFNRSGQERSVYATYNSRHRGQEEIAAKTPESTVWPDTNPTERHYSQLHYRNV